MMRNSPIVGWNSTPNEAAYKSVEADIEMPVSKRLRGGCHFLTPDVDRSIEAKSPKALSEPQNSHCGRITPYSSLTSLQTSAA